MAEVVSTMVQVHIARALDSTTWEHLIIRRAPHEPVFPLQWQVVTGRIEEGETAVQAAVRELMEETGLHHTHLWVLPFVSSLYSPRRDCIVHVPVFGVTVVHTHPVQLSDEHNEFQWIQSHQATELLTIPAQQQAMKLFNEILLHKWDDARFNDVYRL